MSVFRLKLQRWVASFVLICFMATLSPEAYSAIPSVEMAVKAETPRILNIDIPTELATVDEWYQAPSKLKPKLIVHIQDAHSNYEAQTRIRDLIKHLNTHYGFKTILVEGAASELDPDLLKLFPDQERNLKLVDELAKIGEVNGAEMFLVEHADRAKGVGIEKPDLYRKNFDALQKVYSEEEFVSGYFESYEKKLGQIASRSFGPRMIQALAEWRKFESGHRDFLPFISKLAELSKKVLEIDLGVLYSQIEWPQLTRLLVLQRIEKELEQTDNRRRTTDVDEGAQRSVFNVKQQAELEQQQIIELLKSNKSSDGLVRALENFNEKTANLNRIGSSEVQQASAPRALMETLVEEGAKISFDIRDYPAFAKYAGYLILRSEIVPGALFEEIKKLFDLILESLVNEAPSSAMEKSDDLAARKRLLLLHRDEMLARKLLKLELTHDEWLAVLNRQDRFYPEDLNRRMLEQLGQNTRAKEISENEAGQMKRLNESFRAAFTFYSAAVNRDTYFFQRTQEVLAQADKAILITGGFHAEGMKYLFRKYDINYGTLTPRITQNFSSDQYQKVMLTGADVAKDLSANEPSSVFANQTGADQNYLGVVARSEARFGPEMEGAARSEARTAIVRSEARKLGFNGGDIAESRKPTQTGRKKINFESEKFEHAINFIEQIIKSRELIRTNLMNENPNLDVSDQKKAQLMRLLDVQYEKIGVNVSAFSSINSTMGFRNASNPLVRALELFINEDNRNPQIDERFERAIQILIDTDIHYKLVVMRSYLSRVDPSVEVDRYKQKVQALFSEFIGQTKLAQQPVVFSSVAVQSAMFDSDEVDLFKRQQARVDLSLAKDSADRLRRIRYAAQMAIQVGHHLRGIRLKVNSKTNQIVGYETEPVYLTAFNEFSDGAKTNGVDYALLISYIKTLLMVYSEIKNDPQQIELQNELVEAIYAALSADPYLLLDFEKLRAFDKRQSMEDPFAAAVPVYPNNSMVGLEHYFELVESNLSDLKAAISRNPMIQAALSSKNAGHLGSLITQSTYVEAASIVYQILSRDNQPKNFYSLFHQPRGLPELVTEKLAWLAKFDPVVGVADSKSGISSGDVLRFAYPVTMKMLDEFKFVENSMPSGGESSRAEARSETRFLDDAKPVVQNIMSWMKGEQNLEPSAVIAVGVGTMVASVAVLLLGVSGSALLATIGILAIPVTVFYFLKKMPQAIRMILMASAMVTVPVNESPASIPIIRMVEQVDLVAPKAPAAVSFNDKVETIKATSDSSELLKLLNRISRDANSSTEVFDLIKAVEGAQRKQKFRLSADGDKTKLQVALVRLKVMLGVLKEKEAQREASAPAVVRESSIELIRKIYAALSDSEKNLLKEKSFENFRAELEKKESLSANEAIALIVYGFVSQDRDREGLNIIQIAGMVVPNVSQEQISEFADMLRTFFPEMASDAKGHYVQILTQAGWVAQAQSFELLAALNPNLEVVLFVEADLSETMRSPYKNLKIQRSNKIRALVNSYVSKLPWDSRQTALLVLPGEEYRTTFKINAKVQLAMDVYGAGEQADRDLIALFGKARKAQSLSVDIGSEASLEIQIFDETNKQILLITRDKVLGVMGLLGEKYQAMLKIMQSA